jgi:hypothetical protein
VQPNKYEGACHCGVLSYHYLSESSGSQWAVRACQCSFCRSHAVLTISDPAGLLSFRAAEESILQRYRFGARTADFLICRRCGVYVGASTAATSARFGLINIRTLQPFPLELRLPIMMNYEGESAAMRLARREARWTPLASDSL